MKINYKIDKEDDFHPIDILGEIELSDSKNKIKDTCTQRLRGQVLF